MQKIWVLLKIFKIFPMQLLEDFDIVVTLVSKEMAEKAKSLGFWAENRYCRLNPRQSQRDLRQSKLLMIPKRY